MNKQRYILLGILLISVVIYTYYTFLAPTGIELDYGEVSVEEARKLIESRPKIIILDVRTREEYNDGHLEKAMLIPLSELEDRLDEVSKDDELLVYCRTGNRSSRAITILKSNGYSKIYHMKDGITAWIQAGYPTVT